MTAGGESVNEKQWFYKSENVKNKRCLIAAEHVVQKKKKKNK